MATIATASDEKVSRRVGLSRATAAQVASHSPETLITYRVSALAQALARLVDASVNEVMGLTSRQWRFLVVLNQLGTSPSGAVARIANFDHSQVSRVASELTIKGLITQVGDQGDRRKQILSLTADGIECLRKGVPYSLERQAKLQSRLGPGEYASFCHALGVLQDEADNMLKQLKKI